MGEASRRSGRPVSFGLTHSDRRPDLYRRIIEFCRERATCPGACVRPQTTARGIGILFGLESRTPFDGAPVWQELRAATNGRKMQLLRDAVVPPAPDRRRRRPWHQGRSHQALRAALSTNRRAMTCPPDTSLAAIAEERGVSPSCGVHRATARDQRRAQLQLADPQPGPRCGRGDARRPARHAGPRRCRCTRRSDHRAASQPTFLLSYWVQRAQALDTRGGHPPPHLRHRRPVRDRREGPAVRRLVRRRERRRPRRARVAPARVRARPSGWRRAVRPTALPATSTRW